MVDLKSASIKELEAELERKKNNMPPEPLTNPNFRPLQKMIIDSIQLAIQDDEEPKDFEHYVFENAIEAVYGTDFWKWYNKQSWMR